MKFHDRIVRRDGKWKKGRYATVISEPDEKGVILARFGSKGKYFEGRVDNYVVVHEGKCEECKRTIKLGYR